MLALELRGERFELHAQRVLVWPAHALAIVADTHFGKDDAFRRAGIAVPGGVAGADLARLAEVVGARALTRLVVLGDFHHAAPHAADEFHGEFAAFRAAHPRLAIDVVAGNHDRHAPAEARPAGVAWHAQGLRIDGFVLTHDAGADDAAASDAGAASAASLRDGYVLAGHLHPVVVLHGPGGDRARLPALWARPGHAVLPAFGSFTGGERVRREPGDRVFAIAGSRVLEIPGYA